MSQLIDDNRKSWPKERDVFNVGSKDVDPQKVWEPKSDYDKGGQYGKVRATTYRSGHSFEIDETEGGKRIRVTHANGTYMEMQDDGTVVRKSMKDDFEVVAGDKNLRVKGAVNIYIDGDVNAKIGGNLQASVGGEMVMEVDGSSTLKSGGPLVIETPHLDVKGGKMTHNGVNVGSDHKHSDVTPGNGQSGYPV